MKIIIQDVPKEQIARDDVADYRITPEALLIEVASMQDWRHEALIALHEFTECMLAKHRNIDFKEIDEWDATHELKGDDPAAIYHQEHVFAENIERLFAQALEVSWEEYSKIVEEL